MKLTEFHNYRQVLRHELNEWCRGSEKHSLGDFARYIGLTPSRLSEVLSEKKGLSRTSAETIASCLRYSAAETEYFCDLVESIDARSSVLREIAQKRLNSRTGSSDIFKALSDWRHFAILELTCVRDFQSTPDRISEVLRIPLETTAEAIDRLIRLKVIENRSGNYQTLENLEERDMTSVLNRWIPNK